MQQTTVVNKNGLTLNLVLTPSEKAKLMTKKNLVVGVDFSNESSDGVTVCSYMPQITNDTVQSIFGE